MAQLSVPLGGHVDQVGLIVPDLEAAMDGYAGGLGVSFHHFDVDQDMGSLSGSSAQFRVRIAVAQVGTCSIELIQPASGVTFYSKHLETHAPGVHHFGVYVDDLAKARTALAARGYGAILDGNIRDLGEFSYFEAPDLHCVVEPLQLSLKLPLFLGKHARIYRGR